MFTSCTKFYKEYKEQVITKIIMSMDEGKHFLTFTTEEDSYLKTGIVKHANSKRKWADILKDEQFTFQKGRSRDSLRVRATTLGLEKSKRKRKSKSK